MIGLLILALCVLCLILIPLVLLCLVLRIAIALVMLPFRIAGLAIRLTFLLLIPLLPVILVVGAIWMLFKLVRSHTGARLATG